jgi:plasmid stabilization system protein ParE
MPRIKYANRAQLDLVRLYNFLSEKDASVALRAIQHIRNSIAVLGHAPKIGRPVEEGFGECIMDFGSSGYLALYDFDELLDAITVHAVRHQKENDYQ